MFRGLSRLALLTTLLFGGAGCSLALRAAGYPPEANRRTSPTELEQRALAVGAAAPDFEGSGSVPSFALSEARKDGAVVLLFYRGDW